MKRSHLDPNVWPLTDSHPLSQESCNPVSQTKWNQTTSLCPIIRNFPLALTFICSNWFINNESNKWKDWVVTLLFVCESHFDFNFHFHIVSRSLQVVLWQLSQSSVPAQRAVKLWRHQCGRKQTSYYPLYHRFWQVDVWPERLFPSSGDSQSLGAIKRNRSTNSGSLSGK